MQRVFRGRGLCSASAWWMKVDVASALILVLALLIFCAPSPAGESTFVRVTLDSLLAIDLPRNWSYLDEQFKKHLNTATEATLSLADNPTRWGDNVILVAANAYTESNGAPASATLRLSVRKGETVTQAEMQEIRTMPRAEVQELLKPVVIEAERVLKMLPDVISTKLTAAQIEQSRGFTCLFVEFEVARTSRTIRAQTYMCPMGDKSVKLSTSYRVSQGHLFQPVVQYIWKSLSPP